MIFRIEKALDRESCLDLMRVYDRYTMLAQRRDYTDHPILYCLLAEIDDVSRELVVRVVYSCWGRVFAGLELSGSIYPETVILTAIGIGGFHLRHADNMKIDEHGNWAPNHVPQRDFSALLYLNDDFEGGELVFETQRIVIKPRAGLLVAFPSTREYIHEVWPVRSGCRYSMPIWFTRQESFRMPEFISQEEEPRVLEG